MVPTKSLYLESGSECVEPGEIYSALYVKVFSLQMIVFQPILNIFT